MPFDIHTLEVPNGGYGFQQSGRILVACGLAVATVAGGSAGASVSLTISNLTNLPAHFGVLVTCNQDATYYITNKSSTGFTVTFSPRIATNTLNAGSFDWFMFA